MIDDVHLTAYGADASRTLEEAVQKAKGGAPLAPVTVVVGSNFAGLAARRLLGTSSGVANVSFVTPFRLAELLGSDLLLDRRPLTNPVLGAAVRRALAEEPGRFRQVRDHVATETALAALYAELSNVSAATLERLEADGDSRAVSAVRFHRAIASHLVAFHGEADLAHAAAGRTDLAAALVPFGHVIWYLPAPTTAPLGHVIAAVLAAAPSTVVVGVTGDEQADDAVRRTCERAGVAWPPGPTPVRTPVTADRIVSVTDADEEVRAVVRCIVELAEQGVALDRIGVFHPVPHPYVGTLEQQLAAAGIPCNGPSRRTLAESVAGRTLLAALALPGQRWRRDRVLALVSGAPVRAGDELARPTAWETLSREAGVVHGLEDWRRKLSSRRVAIESRLSERRDDGDPGARGGVEAAQRTVEDLTSMLDFVERLAGSVTAVERAAGWEHKSAAATELLRSLLGSGLHPTWPEAEQDALERVEDALSRLAALDEIEPGPAHVAFVRAVQAELGVTQGRRGRFGEGVVYGPLAAAVGHDLDAVFLLGCAEGLCPAGRRDDAMLPDEDRKLAGGELDLRADALHEQHRWFLAALASAPAGRRVLTFPRGDLRSARESLPSRWLLDTASALRGERVHSTGFDRLGPDVVETVASHAAGLVGSTVHASALERDLVVLDAHQRAGGEVTDHPVAEPVRRGIVAQQARRSSAFTEWDGNLSSRTMPSTADRPQSPTGLETWAQCGFRYYLGRVLGLAERDDPERVLDLSPLDRGSGVHEALEDFFAEVIEQGAPEPDEAWTEQHRARLRSIAEQRLAEYERRGRTGRAVNWALTKGDLLALLDDFLDEDARYRARTRSRPERVELPFGLGDAEPVRLTLPSGKVLSFRGKADRVDLGEHGRHLVSDYKTGKGDRYKQLADDPVRAGTTLQLGLYAEAARQHLGAEDVEAHYWMIDTGSGFARHGYPWTEERRDRFIDVVTAIVEGIEGGVFPPEPGEWNNFFRTNEHCTFCEFDQVCLRDRGEQAEVKRQAPELAVRSLLEPAEEPS